jgi:hypothetical protein
MMSLALPALIAIYSTCLIDDKAISFPFDDVHNNLHCINLYLK